MADRKGRVFGRLILTTVHQAPNGPRIDGASVVDAEGRRYGALVFGTGHRAPVIGWRGWIAPWPGRLIHRLPRPLRPVARFLVATRPSRG